MKIRTDFVTNSSSSSFIIARKEELSEIIVSYVTNKMLGKEMLAPDSTEEEIESNFIVLALFVFRYDRRESSERYDNNTRKFIEGR